MKARYIAKRFTQKHSEQLNPFWFNGNEHCLNEQNELIYKNNQGNTRYIKVMHIKKNIIFRSFEIKLLSENKL